MVGRPTTTPSPHHLPDKLEVLSGRSGTKDSGNQRELRHRARAPEQRFRDLKFPIDDAGEAIKDAKFSATVARADALVLVVPEYNHGYPGLLKHALDTNLKEYIHKAVGICGVSAGAFGGIRMVQNLLPVLRELGLVTIFWDGNFSGAQKLFDAEGKILDDAYVRRIDQFLKELIWMAKVLRHRS